MPELLLDSQAVVQCYQLSAAILRCMIRFHNLYQTILAVSIKAGKTDGDVALCETMLTDGY